MQTNIDRQCPACGHYESVHYDVGQDENRFCEGCNDLCYLDDLSFRSLVLDLVEDDPLPPAA